MNNFCLIGYPLGHSMSPIIHKELFKIKNIDASYNLNEIAPENLKTNIKSLKSLTVSTLQFLTRRELSQCLTAYRKEHSFSAQ